jgi:hypothetical protein
MVAYTYAALHLVDLVRGFGVAVWRLGWPALSPVAALVASPRPQVAHLSIVRGLGAPSGCPFCSSQRLACLGRLLAALCISRAR